MATKLSKVIDVSEKIIKLDRELNNVTNTINNFKKVKGKRKYKIDIIDIYKNDYEARMHLIYCIDSELKEEMTTYIVKRLSAKKKKIESELSRLSKLVR